MFRNFHNVITDGYSIPPKCFFNFHNVITDGYSIPPKCIFNFHVITDGYSIPPKCFETFMILLQTAIPYLPNVAKLPQNTVTGSLTKIRLPRHLGRNFRNL